jgi:hypothetical protein
MTDRERWAVYPLLFLTLGIALKDKLIGVINVERVECASLLCKAVLVTDPGGKQQVVVSSNAEGGFVRAAGNENHPTVFLGNTRHLGGLLFVDRQGRVHVNPGSVYAEPAPPRDSPVDKAQEDDGAPRDPPAEQPAKPSAPEEEP